MRNVPDSILARLPKNGGVVCVPFVNSNSLSRSGESRRRRPSGSNRRRNEAGIRPTRSGGKDRSRRVAQGARPADGDRRTGRRSHRAHSESGRRRSRRHRQRLRRNHRERRRLGGRLDVPNRFAGARAARQMRRGSSPSWRAATSSEFSNRRKTSPLGSRRRVRRRMRRSSNWIKE